MEKKYITLKESTELLGINVRTMKKILERANPNELHYTRIDRKILIKKEQLINYIDKYSKI